VNSRGGKHESPITLVGKKNPEKRGKRLKNDILLDGEPRLALTQEKEKMR